MSAPVESIGGDLSPYVRKVLAVPIGQGIAYRIDPTTPFMGEDRFAALGAPLLRETCGTTRPRRGVMPV